MSGNRHADTGIPFTRRSMSALVVTAGMTSPKAANFLLEEMAKKMHRGPRVDTWASARDRAAKVAGLRPSMAARIWHRWRDMKDVSGDALRKLMIAYDALCAANEAKADEYRAERRALEGTNAATDGGVSAQAVGAVPSRHRPPEMASW